jgi:hypothetical protein
VSTWGVGDLAESISGGRVQLPSPPVRCLAAWGHEDGTPNDDDHTGSHNEWSGGFVLEMADGRFAYVVGWCDYTGWGCQDGATLTVFDESPALDELFEAWSDEVIVPAERWDLEPADANRWIADGMPDHYSWSPA